MIVVASVSASAAATAFVPAARIGFSNTPIGPFQTTVLAVFTASAYNSIVLGPISQASLSAAIASASYTYVGISASIGLGKAAIENAIQYTVPIEDALEQVRSGSEPELTTRQKHLRECYVVAEEGADKAAIENAIKTMPNYFSDYDTTVTFITEEELKANHSKMPHGGFVIRTGETGCEGNKHVIEYSLKLDSNPEFTGSVLVAYARAAHRLSKKGECGARSVFDIAPAMLSQMSAEELRAHML